MRKGFNASILICGLILAGSFVLAQAPVTAPVADLTYAQTEPILASVRGGLPDELHDKTPDELQPLWPTWLTQHDQKTRARLLRGDEDTLVNFLVLGTSFTQRPRLTTLQFAHAASALAPGQTEADPTPESILLFKRVEI